MTALLACLLAAHSFSLHWHERSHARLHWILDASCLFCRGRLSRPTACRCSLARLKLTLTDSSYRWCFRERPRRQRWRHVDTWKDTHCGMQRMQSMNCFRLTSTSAISLTCRSVTELRSSADLSNGQPNSLGCSTMCQFVFQKVQCMSPFTVIPHGFAQRAAKRSRLWMSGLGKYSAIANQFRYINDHSRLLLQQPWYILVYLHDWLIDWSLIEPVSNVHVKQEAQLYRWQTARCWFVKLLRYGRTFCQNT